MYRTPLQLALRDLRGQLAEPRVWAGVAVVGAIAAAAIPLVRGAGKKSGEKKASAKKSSSKSESAKSESGSGGSKTKKS